MDTEHCQALTTAELRRHGLLHPEATKRVTLTWPETGRLPSASVDVTAGPVDSLELRGHGELQRVRLSATEPHFGGVRWWLHCPMCERRCAVLFLVDGRFACRQCQGLTYRVWRERPVQRLTRKAWKIQRRLDDRPDNPGSCWVTPSRPDGMHQRTYNQFVEQLEDLQHRAIRRTLLRRRP